MKESSRDAILRYEKSLDCVHCGLCLPKCPTYQQTANEAASPRGRIYLMRGLAEGKLELNESFREKMDLCLVCRACESVCPSGVEFSHMMEITRHEAERAGVGSGFVSRTFRRLLLNRVLPFPRRVAALATMTRLYQTTGLATLVRASGLPGIMPRSLRALERNRPPVPSARERRPLPERTPAASGVEYRGRAAVLPGCVMHPLFPDLNRLTVNALVSRGYEVVAPRGVSCCGALHAHSGDMDEARRLARVNVKAWLDAEPDVVVMNAAGCGAAVREYGHWLEGDDDAQVLAAKTVDLIELIDREDLAVPPLAQPLRATWDAPCHLYHAQRVTTAPERVLRRVEGLDLVPLPGAEHCCGAAGIYNITQPEMSDSILDGKLDALESTGAKVLLTSNPGCHLQWRKGIADRGLEIEVKHPVELL